MATEVQTSSRQYHSTSSAYVLPNDGVEQDRLDVQAAAIVEMIGSTVTRGPPGVFPDRVSRAVDIGCGTGSATIQLAKRFPSTRVYGLDISPVPDVVQETTPRNVDWAQGNILDVGPGVPGSEVWGPLTLGREPQDYIFGRMLSLGINNWSRYFSTCARSLQSRGIIEHQDLDWSFYRVGSS